MIKIIGSTHRSFIFPASWPDSFEFYTDLQRTLNFLNHISLQRSYTDLQLRMLYSTIELGIYRVRIFCDIETDLDRDSWAIRIRPLDGITPVESKAGLYSSAAQGFYTSESLFTKEGDQTRIDYRLQLHTNLPVPLGIRFMPNVVLNNVARSITRRRIHEIAEGFIERSVNAFIKVNHNQGE